MADEAMAQQRQSTDSTPEPKTKERGLGRVYQPTYRDKATREKKVSAVWWIAYYYRGQKRRESSESTKRAVAVKLLKGRIGEMASGKPLIGRDVERTTFEDLKRMLLDDYAVNGRRSVKRATISVAHLERTFALTRAIDITADRVATYIRERQTAKAKPATIQKELAALKRMFTLALRANKVQARPYIPSLEINNTRSGFFEEPDFRAVLSVLPEDIKPIVEFMYLTGWRIGEVLPLEWRRVDLAARTIRLEPGTTKNDDGRTFPFAALPPLEALLTKQRERTEKIAKATNRIIPWVFHRDGAPIKDFRRAWKAAMKTTGLAGRIPHDFRRTAVRNLERAGVPRSVAMKLTGHKTESVYRRYAIVSEADLSAGVAKLAALHQADSRRTVVPLRRRAKSGQSQRRSGRPAEAVATANA